jgi:hypothetical protein
VACMSDPASLVVPRKSTCRSTETTPSRIPVIWSLPLAAVSPLPVSISMSISVQTATAALSMEQLHGNSAASASLCAHVSTAVLTQS